jgi:predicted RNase H-like HicB family nuclease
MQPRTWEATMAGEERLTRNLRVLYQVIEDGWIMASVPELPGAVTQGRTVDEARIMIKEAAELVLAAYRDNAVRDAPGDAMWQTLTVELPAPK